MGRNIYLVNSHCDTCLKAPLYQCDNTDGEIDVCETCRQPIFHVGKFWADVWRFEMQSYSTQGLNNVFDYLSRTQAGQWVFLDDDNEIVSPEQFLSDVIMRKNGKSQFDEDGTGVKLEFHDVTVHHWA